MSFGSVAEANAFFEYKTDKLVLHRVCAGSFLMGSPSDEPGREPSDYPAKETRHPVTLTQDFYLGVFPVTQRQWVNVTGTNPVRSDQMAKLAQASLNPDLCARRGRGGRGAFEPAAGGKGRFYRIGVSETRHNTH